MWLWARARHRGDEPHAVTRGRPETQVSAAVPALLRLRVLPRERIRTAPPPKQPGPFPSFPPAHTLGQNAPHCFEKRSSILIYSELKTWGFCNSFLFFCLSLGSHPVVFRRLFLVLHSGINPDRTWDARDQTEVSHMQGKQPPSCYSISLQSIYLSHVSLTMFSTMIFYCNCLFFLQLSSLGYSGVTLHSVLLVVLRKPEVSSDSGVLHAMCSFGECLQKI